MKKINISMILLLVVGMYACREKSGESSFDVAQRMRRWIPDGQYVLQALPDPNPDEVSDDKKIVVRGADPRPGPAALQFESKKLP